jgi:hypothetical protein
MLQVGPGSVAPFGLVSAPGWIRYAKSSRALNESDEPITVVLKILGRNDVHRRDWGEVAAVTITKRCRGQRASKAFWLLSGD